MQKTIYTILTNKQARTAKEIRRRLNQEFAAGAPWFDKVAKQPAPGGISAAK